MWRPGPLPRRHQPLGDGNSGLPHAEAQPLHERRLRHCQTEEVKHLTELQLHGPAPGLWAHSGPEEPVWQPHGGTQSATLLHHPNEPQRLPAGPLRVHVRSAQTLIYFNWRFCLPPVGKSCKKFLFFLSSGKMALMQKVWGDSCWARCLEGQSSLGWDAAAFWINEERQKRQRESFKECRYSLQSYITVDSWGGFSCFYLFYQRTVGDGQLQSSWAGVPKRNDCSNWTNLFKRSVLGSFIPRRRDASSALSSVKTCLCGVQAPRL